MEPDESPEGPRASDALLVDEPQRMDGRVRVHLSHEDDGPPGVQSLV